MTWGLGSGKELGGKRSGISGKPGPEVVIKNGQKMEAQRKDMPLQQGVIRGRAKGIAKGIIRSPTFCQKGGAQGKNYGKMEARRIAKIYTQRGWWGTSRGKNHTEKRWRERGGRLCQTERGEGG